MMNKQGNGMFKIDPLHCMLAVTGVTQAVIVDPFWTISAVVVLAISEL